MRPVSVEANEHSTVAAVTALHTYAVELEAQHAELLQASLGQLRELTLLSRMTESIGVHRRSFREVVREAGDEIRRVLHGATVWAMQPGRDGQLRAVHGQKGGISLVDLPFQARTVYEQVVAARAGEIRDGELWRVHQGEQVYLGLPVATAKHLLAVLVVRCDKAALAGDGESMRLMHVIARQAAVACENARLIETMGQMVVEMVVAMVAAVESRDPYTGGHTQRVTAYALLLGEALGLGAMDLSVLRLGGLLHDIGKIGVPDAILQKTSALTDAEFEVIKTHPLIGDEIVRRVPQLTRFSPIIRHHHERYDGQGYPDGLQGEAIPLLARVVAIADAFDAMTSSRSYRPAVSVAAAKREILTCGGGQFDPAMAQTFARLSDERLAQTVCRWPNAWECGDQVDALALFDPVEMDLLSLEG